MKSWIRPDNGKLDPLFPRASMRTYQDCKSLVARLTAIFEKDRIVLFAGAGVSSRADLPVWHSYLECLAKVPEQYELLVAKLIRKRIENNLLLQAADAYTGCVKRFASLSPETCP